jgi:hypothetical protein
MKSDLPQTPAIKKKLLVLFALLTFAVPTAIAAPPDGKKPATGNQTAASAVVKACRAERGTTTESMAAFADKYGTNKNKKNAFGKCVSKAAKQKARTA